MKYFIVSLLIISALALDEVDVTKFSKYFKQGVKYDSKIYSGYLDANDNKKIHYVFLPSQGNPSTDPLVIWLNGGPGCSSLLGYLNENGPLIFEDEEEKLQINEYSWNKEANVLYLESPAGVGFSIVEKEEQKVYDDEIVARDNLKAFQSWQNKFPEYRQHPLYVTGESYAGIYVPYIANQILKWNLDNQGKPQDQINLKGILVVNGVADYKQELVQSKFEFMHMRAIINETYKDYIIQQCQDLRSEQCQQTQKQFEQYFSGINIYDIYRKCYKQDDTNSEQFHLFKLSFMVGLTPPCVDDKGTSQFLNDPEIRLALNIPESVQKWEMCNKEINNKFKTNYEKGSYWLYPILIKNSIKILIMTGDTDAAVSPLGTLRWVNRLQIEHNLFTRRPWRRYYVEDKPPQVAGFIQEIDGLILVTVKGAGHMVPQWKRIPSFKLFNNFVHEKPAA